VRAVVQACQRMRGRRDVPETHGKEGSLTVNRSLSMKSKIISPDPRASYTAVWKQLTDRSIEPGMDLIHS
jgi:hypothetical protein